ncbi:hypothetical protein EMCG_08874 [[Emmonsia] crescens]|uniref:Uncharacterized protein n=1 Tax=[Emmonsia] crescens TaxID=73230 RepID=A0A0G2I3R1_9EURO|nr:hypothetical protein EMCG_08874 [Emmonsia crescens UAMH 3008]
MSGHRVVAELLIETGNVDVNTRDEYDWNPLTWTARNRDEEMVYLLLENRANSEYIDAPSAIPAPRYGIILTGHITPQRTRDRQSIKPTASLSPNSRADVPPHYFCREVNDDFQSGFNRFYPYFYYRYVNEQEWIVLTTAE